MNLQKKKNKKKNTHEIRQGSPDKGETAVHGCPYPLGMVMRIPDVLAGLWVGVYVPRALSLYFFSG